VTLHEVARRVGMRQPSLYVENPPRQQLLFQRTIPGFKPSPESYALARRLVDRCIGLLSALGAGDAPGQVQSNETSGSVRRDNHQRTV
jgi:hypothetical protein